MAELTLVCTNCSNFNTIDYDIGDDIPLCQSCGHRLLPAHPVEGDQALLSLLHQQPQLILLNFWGAWSGPCRDLSPIFNDYSDRYRGRIIFVRMNSEEQQVLANQLNVKSFPTLILFQGERELQRLTGFINGHELDVLLEKHVSI